MTEQHTPQLDAGLLLRAYSLGIFPMSESAGDDEVFWVKPELRGIIPLDEFHVSKSLSKLVRQQKFEIRFDSDFDGVIDGCAEVTPKRSSTWINSTIRNAYRQLFDLGHCHTVETWRNGQLVGGVYGVTLGRAFFGESMFSRVPNASKVCLVHLVDRLKAKGFVLFDTQFTTDHLKRFGAIDILAEDYEQLLNEALVHPAVF